MRARFTWPAAVALAVIVTGCTQAPPPAPPDTRPADTKAIEDLETAWSQSFATKDVNKITAFYADDASVYLQDAPVVNGIAAIKAAMTPMLADKNFSLTFGSTGKDVAKSGDIAYSHGAFTQTFTDAKTKKVVTVNGKYLTVFAKQADGGWKAIQDSVSNDGVPKPVAAAKKSK
jgi:uncharacterized protein (TIGR02246 family)